MSLIEILIALTLMGTVVVATMTALTASISASSLDRDHANAHAWLQTAADTLYARDLITCDAQPLADITAAYQTTVQSTHNPEDWAAANIEVIGLEYWRYEFDLATNQETSGWGTICDSPETNLQKVELRVRADDGRIVEEVEVVIGV